MKYNIDDRVMFRTREVALHANVMFGYVHSTNLSDWPIELRIGKINSIYDLSDLGSSERRYTITDEATGILSIWIFDLDIIDKVENIDFSKYTKNDSGAYVSKRRQETYERYIRLKGEVQRHKDIIDHFVYLLDDEQINEFPEESLDILKHSISYIREYIKNNSDANENKILKMAIEEGNRIIGDDN